MSTTRKLTEFYGSFLFGCGKLAISPYTLTLSAFLDPEQPKSEELLVGGAVCAFLTIVVPILPTLTSITFAIAAFAASIALASMFIGYPVALLCDALDTSETSSARYAF